MYKNVGKELHNCIIKHQSSFHVKNFETVLGLSRKYEPARQLEYVLCSDCAEMSLRLSYIRTQNSCKLHRAFRRWYIHHSSDIQAQIMYPLENFAMTRF